MQKLREEKITKISKMPNYINDFHTDHDHSTEITLVKAT